jgi:hypothetical protein
MEGVGRGSWDVAQPDGRPYPLLTPPVMGRSARGVGGGGGRVSVCDTLSTATNRHTNLRQGRAQH